MHFTFALSQILLCVSLTAPALGAAVSSPSPSAAAAGTPTTGTTTPESQVASILAGNRKFAKSIEKSKPGLLKKLTDEGQAPPFMFIGCSDSRVSDNQIFSAQPGALFTHRNIANQFHEQDVGLNSFLSYGVGSLKVQHIIVMGHYGCGGVAASMASRPSNATLASGDIALQKWIEPIREIYESSSRTEIVSFRNNAGNSTAGPKKFDDPAFVALVEENVKAGVKSLAASDVIQKLYASLGHTDTKVTNMTMTTRAVGGGPQEVFIHGWVYNIETGLVRDLGVTVSPPGVEFKAPPAAAVKAARDSFHAH